MRAFTLIEILLVLALIALTLGVISTQAPKALKGERFERGVDQVKSRIALAQELMLNYQTDVVLYFEPQDEGLLCTIIPAKPISEKLAKSVNRHALIKGIDRADFNGHSIETLEFDGTIGATPKGKLILKEKNREATLTLKGYPSLIIRGDHVTEEASADYPETVLSLI